MNYTQSRKITDSTSAADRVTYRYDRLGELVGMTDQNGTVHSHGYDKLGRFTADSVLTLGTGIDGAVQRIARTYDRPGRLQKVTSWSAESSPVAPQLAFQSRRDWTTFARRPVRDTGSVRAETF